MTLYAVRAMSSRMKPEGSVTTSRSMKRYVPLRWEHPLAHKVPTTHPV